MNQMSLDVVDDLPFITEDCAEAVAEVLVAVGVTGSRLDLESAITKWSSNIRYDKYLCKLHPDISESYQDGIYSADTIIL